MHAHSGNFGSLNRMHVVRTKHSKTQRSTVNPVRKTILVDNVRDSSFFFNPITWRNPQLKPVKISNIRARVFILAFFFVCVKHDFFFQLLVIVK